ncbi:MAG: glycosyltransferase, partial [Dethiobacteraceae bacterium]
DEEIAAILNSSSWRLTRPLRLLGCMSKGVLYLLRIISQVVAKMILKLVLRFAVFLRVKKISNQPLFEPLVELHEAELNIESAEIRGGRLEVSGWVFHKISMINAGHISVLNDNNQEVRKIPLRIQIERMDVHAIWKTDNSLRSGFQGEALLNETISASLQLEFEFADGSIISSRIYPRMFKTSIWRVLQNARRLANRHRILQGINYLFRGKLRQLWSRVVWMAENVEVSTNVEPVGLKAALDLVERTPVFPAFLKESVDIIIPVYNGLEYLDKLFYGLQCNTPSPHRLIVIDDASPDLQIWLRLKELLGEVSNAILLRNELNLGFVATVNRAAEYVKGDFVILNTDVEIPPKWLERLMAPICKDRTVASTTPFSNAATICSFPDINVDNPLIADLEVQCIDRWFARVRRDLPEIELPTGVGFCMGINGETWRRIGPFDAEGFRRGYGEENDWCQRARKFGYRSVMVTNLFVYHKHGGSFDNTTRQSLRESALRTVLARYPDYQHQVDIFIRHDPARALRQLMTMFVTAGEAAKLPLLIVDHELGGGANNYRNELVSERLAADQPVLLLAAHRDGSLFREGIELRCFYREYTVSFNVEDLVILERLFADHLPLGEVFYNNAVSFKDPLLLVETLHRIKAVTGARLTIAIHDFYPLCPSYTLINNEGKYCRLPDIASCRVCLPKNRFSVASERVTIAAWRQTWGTFLAGADKILCFSEDSRHQVERVYPNCGELIAVRPHKLSVIFSRNPKLNSNVPMHIGVVGAIGYVKGAQVVVDLARHLLSADPSARITVIGSLENAPILRNLKVTGPYRREDLPELLELYGINVCFLPSICPETFSYVTEELMCLDVPLVVFNLGAPAERVRLYPKGRIVCEMSAEAAAYELVSLYRTFKC